MVDVDAFSMMQGMAEDESRKAYLPGGDAGVPGGGGGGGGGVGGFLGPAEAAKVEGPGPGEERRLVIEAEEAESGLQAGRHYYLVAARWWIEWRQWCGDALGERGPRATCRPGAIDNRILLDMVGSAELKKGIAEHQDYEIVSESVWALLHGWYGGGPTVKRRAVAAVAGGEVTVELHGLMLSVHRSSDPSAVPTAIVESRATTVAAFKRHACEELGLESGKVRVWDYFNKKRHALLEDRPDATLDECTMVDNNDILLESQLEDGSWPPKEEAAKSSHGEITRGTPPCRGVVGLQNLGNTCFMNSSIQCLANIPSIRDHFRDDTFRDRLNKQAFKTQGRLAETFAQLMRDMWSPSATQVAPREFKYQIGQFAEQFTGYRQHDSMEFIEYLLDGLKEDVNRVQGAKPFVELKEAEGRADEPVAEEARLNYRVRNDSYIDDLFLGFYKSTVTCTHEGCDRVSVKFDPFLSIKVPLTNSDEDRTTTLTVAVVSRQHSAIARHKVRVQKSGTVGDLIELAAKAADLDRAACVLTEVYMKKIYRFFEAGDSLDNIRSSDVLVLYEADDAARAAAVQGQRWSCATSSAAAAAAEPAEASDAGPPARCGVVIQMRKSKPAGFYGGRELVGIPLVASMPRTSKACDLILAVRAEVERHIPDMREGWSLYWAPDKNGAEDCSAAVGPTEEAVTLAGRPLAYLIVEWPEQAVPEGVSELQEAVTGGGNGSLSDSRAANAVRLEKCIQMFTETDRLSGDDLWYCNRCKEHREALKKMEFWSLPPVLLLQLKRFTYTRYTRERLDTDVLFPLEGLDMSPHVMYPPDRAPQVFDLVALSLHGGSLGGGHYVAYARSSENGRWYYFNDSFCQEVQPAEVAKEQSGAYVLFYLRRDQRPPSWGPPAA